MAAERVAGQDLVEPGLATTGTDNTVNFGPVIPFRLKIRQTAANSSSEDRAAAPGTPRPSDQTARPTPVE
jgi:hypothetical protein